VLRLAGSTPRASLRGRGAVPVLAHPILRRNEAIVLSSQESFRRSTYRRRAVPGPIGSADENQMRNTP
jgi:hypothetical protein